MKKRALSRALAEADAGNADTPSDQIDIMLLKQQNSALAGQLYQYKQTISKLNGKCSAFEARENAVTSVVSCVNRHWERVLAYPHVTFI
jgi:hypothetical protein